MGDAGISPIELMWILIWVLFGLLIATCAIAIVSLVKNVKLNKKYKTFLNGANGITMEEAILEKFKEIDLLKAEEQYTSEKLNVACETLLTAYQKIGIVKYDAFKEMGGKLSFSLCLLDDENNGFILTSMHTREGCYTYIKEIIKGESFVVLASEERKALEEAKNKRNLYAE